MRRAFFCLWVVCAAMLGCVAKVQPVPPNPAPIVEPITQGLKVLIVHESGNQPTAKRGQLAVMFSTKVHKWLREHCKQGYLIVDQNDLSGEWEEFYQASTSKALPWLIVGDGNHIIHNGPLPDDVEEFLSLLGEYSDG